MNEIRFLRLPQVIDRVGLKQTAIYERVRAGTFPKPRPIGGRAVAWIESEITEWQMAIIGAAVGASDSVSRK